MTLVKKKIYIFFIIIIIFSPRFRRLPRMTAPLAFTYAAYAQGRLCCPCIWHSLFWLNQAEIPKGRLQWKRLYKPHTSAVS